MTQIDAIPNDPYQVPSGLHLSGRIRVPSSKSITQRYFNLALIGRMELEILRPLDSEDPRLFLAALAAAGFTVTRGADRVRLSPGPPPAEGEIFCGNGGTMFRFLTAALTTVPGTWQLDGVARLRQRPVGPLIAALRQLGAEIDCPERDGYAPLRIRGGTLRGGRAGLDAGTSSQFLSALLMAGLVAPEPVTVEVAALRSEPYVDLTLDAIRELGGEPTCDGDRFAVAAARFPDPALREVEVEGDFSTAAYPAAAAALSGSTVRIDGLRPDSRQGDRGLVDLLARMGAGVRWHEGGLEVTGPAEPLRAVTADMAAMPDQVPTLAALAPFARGTTRIHNVPHLRLKECDRLHAMAEELARLGAAVDERPDGLVIAGCWADEEPPATPVEVATWGDHRIAMSLALVGLRRPGVAIREPAVVAKSYPAFWRDLEELMRR